LPHDGLSKHGGFAPGLREETQMLRALQRVAIERVEPSASLNQEFSTKQK
jgi:hypothetical protein